MKQILVTLLALGLLAPVGAFAQTGDAEPAAVDEEETSYIFEPDIVDGTRTAPVGELVAGQSHGRTSRLIELRSDFVAEIVTSWNAY